MNILKLTMPLFAVPMIVTVLAGLTVASCAPQSSAPQQVQSTAPSNPTVTYSGGGIGAGVGALGGLLVGAPLEGALIGGAVGAGAGALTNKHQVNLGRPIWR